LQWLQMKTGRMTRTLEKTTMTRRTRKRTATTRRAWGAR